MQIRFVFKVALALFTVAHEDIVACKDFETTLMYIQKQLPLRDNRDAMKLAMQLKVTPEMLDDYAQE